MFFYKRYVADTFFIFDGTERQVNQMVNKINRIFSNIQFIIELENDKKQLNFLYLTITNNNKDTYVLKYTESQQVFRRFVDR